MDKFNNILYPETFNSKYIKEYWDYEGDLKTILEKSGCVEDFNGKYKQRLRFLDEREESCIDRKTWFERLKGTDGLYSMRFDRMQKNIRIIFAFVSYKRIKYAILLYPFEEKDNKNNSKYSYGKAIEVAYKRLKEVKEESD